MLFLEGESVIYHQRSFFEENSVMVVAQAMLFLEGESVIYHQRLFFKENSVMVVAQAMVFLEGESVTSISFLKVEECYISSETIFFREN